VADLITIVECPRDAWQGLPKPIPAKVKAEYLLRLVAAGFTHIDAVSFVSPATVPQMADSEQVLDELGPAEKVELIGVVVNAKGAERAIATGGVQTLGFPYSISPQFLQRNQHQTPEQSLDALDAISTLADAAGLGVVAYLSMAFGNPYGELWSLDEVVGACDLLVEAGVRQISLADTVGLATVERIAETVATVRREYGEIEVGVHLHARRGDVPAHVRAAYQAGCRRFDSALGGLGGCPFAQDVLVGNIPTETLIMVLAECGATVPPIGPLEELIHAGAEIAKLFGPVVN